MKKLFKILGCDLWRPNLHPLKWRSVGFMFLLVFLFSPNSWAQKGGKKDTTPPTIPAGLLAAPVSQTRIDLTWSASTDASGVAGYRIYRGGTQIATTSQTLFSDTGVAAGSTYCYSVAAYDPRNNTSAQSSPDCATN